ncbi:uncharacterized protein LOC121735309 [Aricia agestis]|uniref:uncharacterized protein LOC121735309 n=1 Tax=Aricia agestis TaxID=91739 RepID=UPI001C2099B9|nr:uncharacterized protein LOC121735309 [Aricia agestis]
MDRGGLDVPTGAVNLDTVRSLHQTVVSLRTALEVSKSELKELKEKYEEHSRCIEFSDLIEKLTLENHILRRKIIDSDIHEKQNIELEVIYSPRVDNIEDSNKKELIDILKSNENQEVKVVEDTESKSFIDLSEERNDKPKVTSFNEPVDETNNHTVEGSESLPKKEFENKSSFSTKLELLSKFDVKIKVKTLKEGSFTSSSSDDTSSNKESKTDEKSDLNLEKHMEHFEKIENSEAKVNIKTSSSEFVKMAVPNENEVKSNVDKFGVQVRITSEDSVTVQENVERERNKDTLNLDVDSLSLRSMSEGDNSVFSDGTTPNEARQQDEKETENASGNESEEVDDIELIFTTDESKDMSNLQEDLVSIRENENWTPSSSTTHSTPVLIKFHTLDPDFQSETPKPKTPGYRDLRTKRVSLPNDKEIRHVGFNSKNSLDLPGKGILKSHNKSDNTLYRKSPNASTRRLDSVDSLSGDYNRMSLDHTKSSSFELGSSLDVLHRDESVDSFYKARLGHRFSVFAETDISKCGISEDDLASNLNIRRNTCPNPFQYRLPYRGPSRSYGKRRTAGVRRESSAQTDLSALPPKWTSDGNLAYKIPELGFSMAKSQRRAPRPAPRPDDPRRVLLSDIGFTSMVPELSRSAEPLWKMQQAHDSPLPRYISRGSYRSPCPSIDRSNDWVPQSYGARGWRSSLPDVRNDDTDELMQEVDNYLRRSVDNLPIAALDRPDSSSAIRGEPYIPSETRRLRLGHTVKVIAPHGRLAVGRVRYVGVAGCSATQSAVVVGAECVRATHPWLPRNDGAHAGRKYFAPAPHHTALFVPAHKVVLAWAD